MKVGDLVRYYSRHGSGIGVIVGDGAWHGQYIVAIETGEQVVLTGKHFHLVKKCP